MPIGRSHFGSPTPVDPYAGAMDMTGWSAERKRFYMLNGYDRGPTPPETTVNTEPEPGTTGGDEMIMPDFVVSEPEWWEEGGSGIDPNKGPEPLDIDFGTDEPTAETSGDDPVQDDF